MSALGKRTHEAEIFPLSYILDVLPWGIESQRRPDIFPYNNLNDYIQLFHPQYGQVFLQKGDSENYWIKIDAIRGFQSHLDDFKRFWKADGTSAYSFYLVDDGHFLQFHTNSQAQFDDLMCELLHIAHIEHNPNHFIRARHL